MDVRLKQDLGGVTVGEDRQRDLKQFQLKSGNYRKQNWQPVQYVPHLISVMNAS